MSNPFIRALRSGAGGLACVLTLSTCDTPRWGLVTTPPLEPLRAAVPDLRYRLSPDQLERVRPGFNVSALERLLGMINPSEREFILSFFQYPTTGELVVDNLFELDDPALQAVLEEVWAPYWDLLPPEALDLDLTERPGREIARRRRVERARTEPGPI